MVSRISQDFLTPCDTAVLKLFLFSDVSLYLTTNTNVLNPSVNLILSSAMFDGPITWKCFLCNVLEISS